MIPTRLQLENFMSYGKGVPELKLAEARLACLSGDNGNGKSALLDAITWALFGETRAPREDDVIRLGTPSAQVLLDFRIGTTDYRVRKQRDRKGGSVWSLQAFQEDGTLRPLSDGRETKARIESLLRMDYKTFLSTAYLRQGDADVFAKATPAERKRVLGEILDLSRYDDLEKRAREKQRTAKEKKTQLEQLLVGIDTELEDRDRLDAERADAEEALALAETQLEPLQKSRDTAQTAYAQLEEIAQKAQEWEELVRGWESEVDQNNRECERLRQRIAAAEQHVLRRPELEAAEREASALDQRIQTLQAQFDGARTLYAEKEQLTAAIHQARNDLDRELYRLDTEIRQLAEEANEIERYDAEIATSTAEIAAYGDPDTSRRSAEEIRQRAEDAMAELKARHGAAKAEQERLLKRRDALETTSGSLCEYCGQALTAAGRAEALAATDAEYLRVEERLAVLAQQARDVQREAKQARATIESAMQEAQHVARIESRRAQAEQERLRLLARIELLPQRKRRHAQLRQQFERGEFAQSEQERLITVSAQLEKLERVGEELRTLRAQREKYHDLSGRSEKLRQAEEILRVEPERLAELNKLVTEREEKIAKGRPRIAEARARATDLPSLQLALSHAEYALKQQHETIHRATRKMGEVTAMLDRLKAREAERTGLEAERKLAAHDELIYTELALAFGKKGVPALIIENALPEIEAETNRLLERMTGGAMKVTFETQREASTKAAGTIETLDIRIADDLGERPLSMFSGGEAFRVNLALRVAMSRLLARRAGAPLQTLILDEGFGTQDPRGREAIADALEAIAEEFSLILVITHIEELKDRFPTRIEVTKGPTGSTFTIA